MDYKLQAFSLLTMFSKILEYVMCKQVMNNLSSNSILAYELIQSYR